MMEEMDIEDFESFLKTQADKHRMYPDDKVWRNINQQLHGNSRWPALTFAAILTGALLMAGMIFLHPNKELFKIPVSEQKGPQQQDQSIASNQPNPVQTNAVDIRKMKPAQGKTVYPYVNDINNATVTNDKDGDNHKRNISDAANSLDDKNVIPTIPQDPKTLTVNSGFRPRSKTIGNEVSVTDAEFLAAQASSNNGGDGDNDESNMVVNSDKTGSLTGISPRDIQMETEAAEKLVDQLAKAKGEKHLSLQVYGGSNISYRVLSEPDAYDYHNPYNSAISGNPSNVNSMVKQSPAVGFEIGTALSYPLTKNLRIKAGLQFNYRQYNISAFASPTAEPSVIWQNSDHGRDSTIVYSSIRNGDGSAPISLRNRYFQLGIPVGLDWIIAQRKKMSFTLGATIQPTYQLNTDMYMITSDYKGYTQQANMVRKFNFNGSAEAMFNFKAGQVMWQVGPQVRYQFLPTQLNSYSVHEHMIDYGVKVGIIKQLK